MYLLLDECHGGLLNMNGICRIREMSTGVDFIAGMDSSSNEWKRYRSFPPRDVEISFEAIVRVSGKK